MTTDRISNAVGACVAMPNADCIEDDVLRTIHNASMDGARELLDKLDKAGQLDETARVLNQVLVAAPESDQAATLREDLKKFTPDQLARLVTQCDSFPDVPHALSEAIVAMLRAGQQSGEIEPAEVNRYNVVNILETLRQAPEMAPNVTPSMVVSVGQHGSIEEFKEVLGALAQLPPEMRAQRLEKLKDAPLGAEHHALLKSNLAPHRMVLQTGLTSFVMGAAGTTVRGDLTFKYKLDPTSPTTPNLQFRYLPEYRLRDDNPQSVTPAITRHRLQFGAEGTLVKSGPLVVTAAAWAGADLWDPAGKPAHDYDRERVAWTLQGRVDAAIDLIPKQLRGELSALAIGWLIPATERHYAEWWTHALARYTPAGGPVNLNAGLVYQGNTQVDGPLESRLIPFVGVEWKVTDNVKLSNRLSYTAWGAGGPERAKSGTVSIEPWGRAPGEHEVTTKVPAVDDMNMPIVDPATGMQEQMDAVRRERHGGQFNNTTSITVTADFL